ncbi:MAG: hypothetical protein HQ580_19250 [Planctomycetes bacterium]|nr:hypothetical protein [Planctomycetota bacterium]
MLFAISALIQEKQAQKYCFDQCGKIIIGGLDDATLGPCFPCRQEDCPFEFKRTSEPVGDVDGIPVYIRRLID